MRDLFKGKNVILMGMILVLVIAGIGLTVWRIGQAYRLGISSFEAKKTTEELTLKKKKIISKITIKRQGEENCIEVTPDGIVRVYRECGTQELESANRLTNPKSVLKLFKLVSETDLSKLDTSGEGELYQLILETDEGTEVVYIVFSDDSPPVIEEIIETIENVEEEIPDPTPIPNPSASMQLFPSGGATSPPQASGVVVSPSPSATPGTGGSQEVPFNCDYQETSQNKPVNVSNTICTSEPVPGQ